MNEPTLALMYERAVDEIEQSLESAIRFLCKYESLISQNSFFIDVDYEEIELAQACFRSSVKSAYIQSSMCVSIFRRSVFSDQMNIISAWMFQFYTSADVFGCVEQHKSLINHVLESLRSGLLEMPETEKLTQEEVA